jgi:hypothetical protein
LNILASQLIFALRSLLKSKYQERYSYFAVWFWMHLVHNSINTTYIYVDTKDWKFLKIKCLSGQITRNLSKWRVMFIFIKDNYLSLNLASSFEEASLNKRLVQPDLSVHMRYRHILFFSRLLVGRERKLVFGLMMLVLFSNA